MHLHKIGTSSNCAVCALGKTPLSLKRMTCFHPLIEAIYCGKAQNGWWMPRDERESEWTWPSVTECKLNTKLKTYNSVKNSEFTKLFEETFFFSSSFGLFVWLVGCFPLLVANIWISNLIDTQYNKIMMKNVMLKFYCCFFYGGSVFSSATASMLSCWPWSYLQMLSSCTL